MSILGRFPALTFPLYRRYWLASLGSVGGWQIAALAMGWLTFDLTGSALDLGILGAATAVPAILLTLVGGVIADRFNKRTVLLTTTAMNTLLLFALAAIDALGLVSVWHVWLVAAGISLVSGVDWPTRQSFFPKLIDGSAMLSAVALNSVLWQFTRMVLPATGGVLLALYDTALIFALAGCGYLIMWSVLLTLRVDLPGSKTSSPWQQTVEGITFILRQPLFRNLIILSYATMFFLSSYMQLMPAFADLFGAGPAGFGVLMSATGVGSILGTLLAGALPGNYGYGRWMLGGALLAALLVIAFAQTALVGQFYAGMLLALGAALGTSIFLILSTTILQIEVPEHLRGRVMGIHGITYSLMSLGGLLSGAIAQQIGTPQAVMWCLSAYIVILLWVGFGNAQIRGLANPSPA
ncbi:MAG: MFS transporter [Pseudomonadota bacterium]